MLLDELSATLALSTGDGGQSRFDIEDACSARGGFVIARTTSGAAIGCGACRRHDYGVEELKRIYSRPEYKGVGTAIVRRLEQEAINAGYGALIVGTRASNRRAIAMYERNGYKPTGPFGFHVDVQDARCFIKLL
jgi:GNAT superfamily N-acetyltransferase